MRVALVTNALDQPTRGSLTTIRRWQAHVKGVEIAVLPARAAPPPDPVPDVVHGYHALHGGVAAMELARRLQRPLVISLGGTDVWACLQGDALAWEVLDYAACVTGAFPAFGEMLSLYFDRDLPYATVPRGVVIPEAAAPRVPDGELRVLLPAGLRPVKDHMLAIGIAERLVARGMPVRLLMLGPEMDRAYARRVRDRIRPFPWISLEERGFHQMAKAYRNADVVWNTSYHEGGSNAILEAVAHGCAVFARDITGNHELLKEPGAPEGLFDPRDIDGAVAYHRRILEETTQRRAERVARGHAWLRAHHDPHEEARRLVAVWRSVAS